MKILAVDPLAAEGHVNFNRVLLRALGELGEVTLATYPEYHTHFSWDNRLDIPDSLNGASSKVGRRVNHLRALSHVLMSTNVNGYDFVMFLSYDELAFSMLWPKRSRTFVMEHNNLDSLPRSRTRRFFYRRTSKHVHHLTCMNYIAEHIQNTYGAKAHGVCHPYYRSPPACWEPLGTDQNGNDHRRRIIFSPSRSTDELLLRRLTSFVSQDDKFFLVAKGASDQRSECFRHCRHFENYEHELRSCDYVFFGGRYTYRVSGVVFEGLSYGKPALALDCQFARELQKIYPNSVYTVNDMAEIDRIRPDYKALQAEHQKFLEQHSFESLRHELAAALNN